MAMVADTNLQATLSVSLQALWYKDLSNLTFSKWSLVQSIVFVKVIINLG